MTTHDLKSQASTDKPLCADMRRHGLALVIAANGAGMVIVLAITALLRA